jgi:hypothetical protein
VSQFDFLKLTSGAWTLRANDYEIQPFVLSPFAPNSGADLRTFWPFVDPAAKIPSLSISGKRQPKLKGSPIGITGSLKYGDCMIIHGWNAGSQECIATQSPGGTEILTVDAQPFLWWAKDRALSKRVLMHYCEEYFWNSVGKPPLGGGISWNPCAAARSRTLYQGGCASLIETHFPKLP